MTDRRLIPAALWLIAASAGAHDAGPSDASRGGETQVAIAARAQALLDTTAGPPGSVENLYGISRRELLRASFDAPSRRDWSYWPRARAGLSLGRMTVRQRGLTHELLRSVLSPRGYLKAAHVMKLEEVLAGREVLGFDRGAEHYFLTIFGTPGDAPWGLRFEGHHLSLNLTMTAAGVSSTPSFFGAAPATGDEGPLAGFAPLGEVQALGFALLRSLGEVQRRAAVLAAEAPGDVLSSPFGKHDPHRWREVLSPDGLPATQLDARQAELLDALLAEVLGDYRAPIAARGGSAGDAGIEREALHFAWLGGEDPHAPHYFRLQSGTFVYEFDAAGERGNHVHTVRRDRDDDFGAVLLERHYRESVH